MLWFSGEDCCVPGRGGGRLTWKILLGIPLPVLQIEDWGARSRKASGTKALRAQGWEGNSAGLGFRV